MHDSSDQFRNLLKDEIKCAVHTVCVNGCFPPEAVRKNRGLIPPTTSSWYPPFHPTSSFKNRQKTDHGIDFYH